MKLQYALPLLSAAACVMAFGLTFNVSAQEQERPQIRVGGAAAQNQGEEAESTAGSGVDPRREPDIEYQRTSPRTRVTFNLEDADLPDLVRLMSNLTGKRFILPGKVRSIKATVFSPTKVSVSEAYNAFLSILEVNGLTVVPAGRYLKIAETSNIENQPISLYTGNGATPSSDRYMTRLHRVQNVAAEDVATLVARFKSAAGSVTAYAPTNTLIITDTGRQIRRMLRVIEAIDVPRTGEQIWIEPVHYADASEIASRLAEIFPSSGASASSTAMTTAMARARAPRRRSATAMGMAAAAAASAAPTTVGSRSGEMRITNILADERTNSLIILATERAYLRILEMIRHLDVPLEGEGRIHVHYVQNGDAAEIASTLSSLIGGSGGSSMSAMGTAAMRRATPTMGAAGASLGDLFEGDIRVTTHEPTNALVITSSLHDYASLRRVIERLDRPRRQVFIEAVVMELEVTRSTELGFSFHGGVPDPAGEGSLSILGWNAQNSALFPNQDSLSGLALGLRGPEIEVGSIPGASTGLSIPGFGVVLNALATSGDANVLSTPHIIAMDNVQAEINVGQNVPLQTNGVGLGGGGLGALGGLGGLGALAGGQAGGAGGLLGALGGGLAGGGGGFGVPRQDVGTIIRVTPHINQHDEIRLEIEEEISEVGTSGQGNLGVASINRRTAKTEVQVRDQQTIVIGGLMRDQVVNEESKIPVLGDIPLLGALFRSTTQRTQKLNLLLFLTPYIIRDMSDLRAIYEQKMRERQEFLDRYFVFGDHDYEPPVDYSRTSGLVSEIIEEIDHLDMEAELAAAIEAEPPPEHRPRSPVGTYEVEGGEGGVEGGDVVIEPDSGGGGDAQLAEPPTPSPTPQLSITPGLLEQQQ